VPLQKEKPRLMLLIAKTLDLQVAQKKVAQKSGQKKGSDTKRPTLKG